MLQNRSKIPPRREILTIMVRKRNFLCPQYAERTYIFFKTVRPVRVLYGIEPMG